MTEIDAEESHSRGIAGTIGIFLLKIPFQIFLIPGHIILWYRYMHAKHGTITISARQRHSLPHAVFFSLVFWMVILFFTVSAVNEQHEKTQLAKSPAVQETETVTSPSEDTPVVRENPVKDAALSVRKSTPVNKIVPKAEAKPNEAPSYSTRNQVF